MRKKSSNWLSLSATAVVIGRRYVLTGRYKGQSFSSQGAIYECKFRATGVLARCRPAGDSYSVASGELQPCSKAFAQDFSRFVQSAYDHDCLTFVLFLQEPLDTLLAVFGHPRDRVQLDAGFNRSLERHPVHMIKQVLCEAHR